MPVPAKVSDVPARREWVPAAVRISSHLVVWAAVIIPVGVVLATGWIPTGDDAAIAIRAHQSLTLHPPLLGMFSTLANSSGRATYDPGPLLFWLLAVPVRLDPVHGSAWGAALFCGAALSVAVEAVWSTRQWVGCAVLAFAAADYLWLVTAVFENPSWNAFFPVPFIIAALAIAWVVASGSVGWWPVLVLVGSVAAQGQLIFTIPAVVLVVTAPIIALGVAGRPDRLRWMVVGVVVGVACWAAPIVQQLGSHGNVSALAASGRGLPRIGATFGLRAVGMVGSPSALWLHRLPEGFFGVIGAIAANSPILGVAVLVIVALVAVLAWRAGRCRLCALAAVAFVGAVSAGIALSVVPQKNELSLDYTICFLWGVSILVWTAVVWGIVALLASSDGVRRGFDQHVGRHRARMVGGLVAIGVPLAVVVVGASSLSSYVPQLTTVGLDTRGFRTVIVFTGRIERAEPRGPVTLKVSSPLKGYYVANALTEGIAWRLQADGWRPGLVDVQRAYTGLDPQPGAPEYIVTVAPDGRVTLRSHPG